MMVDFWAHGFSDNPNLLNEVEDEDFDLAAEMARIDAEEEARADGGLSVDDDDWEVMD